METTVARPASAPSVTTVRIYLRRSLDDEKQQASLETQRAICDRFIASHGFTVAEIVPYTDEKRSGDDFTRPGLVALLSDVRRGDVVVAYDDSRLGRDALMVALMIRQIARDRGARVFYAATGTEAKSADFTDDIVNVARGAGAEGELKKIRQRTRDGVRARVEAGYWSGLAPYGYRLVPDESTRTDRGCKVWLRVAEPRAPIVRRIYADYAAGAGYVQIAKRLNTDGVPGPGGRPWQPDRVHDILRASIYRGVVTFGATRTIRQGGRHVGNVAADPADIIRQSRPELAIVDAALADAVDAAHAARKATPRPRHVVHPLSGWARCGACGGSISTRGGRNSDGSMRTFYVCDRWRRIGDCSVRTSIRAEMVESAIATALVSDVLSDTDIAEARRTVRAALETEAARLRALSSSDTAAMESELTSLRAQKERAIK